MDVSELIVKVQDKVSIDVILQVTMYSALVGFLLTTALMLVTNAFFMNFSLSVLCLYLFIGVAWVNQSRKNGINTQQTTKEVAMIVLGTVLLIVTIAIAFKIWEALQII